MNLLNTRSIIEITALTIFMITCSYYLEGTIIDRLFIIFCICIYVDIKYNPRGIRSEL